MRISDWSSDVCSSDLATSRINARRNARSACTVARYCERAASERLRTRPQKSSSNPVTPTPIERSEEHTSELQSLMRISYAVFCLKKKKTDTISIHQKQNKRHKLEELRLCQ